MVPETRYAKSGDVNIAYQVVGDGPFDLVTVPGWVSHLEFAWEEPTMSRFLRRLASFSRLILLDRRGTGLSDRVADLPTLEQKMDDVRAVMDAAGSEHASLFGISEGGPMCAMFAATYPERTRSLALYGTIARGAATDDYPWGLAGDQSQAMLDRIEEVWGTGYSLRFLAPSLADSEEARRNWGRFERLAVSPGAARRLIQILVDTDVRDILPAVHTPTLVVHRTGDVATPVGAGRYIAERIPGARYVELPGNDHFPWTGDTDRLLDEVEEFLTGERPSAEADRVLATVLFTDVVGSTELAVERGDRAWAGLLEGYQQVMREQLRRFRGHEVDTAGDGFFATFDGPARAIRCACAARDAVAHLGLKVRSGLHTGECEVIGEKVGGIAVHLGSRVVGVADPGEVLVSTTVKDLVAGAGLHFRDRGVHPLKGIPGEWRLFAAEA